MTKKELNKLKIGYGDVAYINDKKRKVTGVDFRRGELHLKNEWVDIKHVDKIEVAE